MASRNGPTKRACPVETLVGVPALRTFRDAPTSLDLRHRHVLAAHVHLDRAVISRGRGIEHGHRSSSVRPRARDPIERRVGSGAVVQELALLERIVAQHEEGLSRLQIDWSEAACEDARWCHVVYVRQA